MGMTKAQHTAGNYLAQLCPVEDTDPALWTNPHSLANVRLVLLLARDRPGLTDKHRMRCVGFVEGVLLEHPEYFARGDAAHQTFKHELFETYFEVKA